MIPFYFKRKTGKNAHLRSHTIFLLRKFSLNCLVNLMNDLYYNISNSKILSILLRVNQVVNIGAGI